MKRSNHPRPVTPGPAHRYFPHHYKPALSSHHTRPARSIQRTDPLAELPANFPEINRFQAIEADYHLLWEFLDFVAHRSPTRLWAPDHRRRLAGRYMIPLLLAAGQLLAQPTDTLPINDRLMGLDSTPLVQPGPLLPDAFPSLAALLITLDSFQTAQCTATLEEFQDSKKNAWLAWLPTLGAAYVPTFNADRPARLRPTISYSLSNVERNLHQREATKAKRQAITDQCQLDTQKAREKIWEMYQRRLLLLEQLRHQAEVLAIDTQLFEFYTNQFKEVKIPADFYLGEKRKYLDKQFAYHQAQTQIQLLEIEIRAAAHLEGGF